MPTICLIGIEPDLAEYCRRALEELGATDWRLFHCEDSREIPEAETYVWNFQRESASTRLRPDIVARSLFVVDPQLLHRLRAWLGAMRASIVIRPVRPDGLRPFLQHSIRQQRPAEDGPVSIAELDDLLPSLLSFSGKLQEYHQAHTNFLARAMHDLRAPLTALGGYCGLLIEQRLGPLTPVQVDLLRRMEHSIKRVCRLADSMFELGAGRNARNHLNLKNHDIEGSIRQAIHGISAQMDEKRIQLSIAIENPGCPLVYDAARIEQVLEILLENACKFTPKRGTIDVCGYPVFWSAEKRDEVTRIGPGKDQISAVELPNAFRIDVRDSGMSVTAERLQSIFEEYASYSGAQDRSGAGLGLATCRMIVDAHHGCVWAESFPSGAQFSMVLPYSAKAGAHWMKERAAATAGGLNT